MIEELIIYLHKKHNKISWQEVKKRWFRTNCVESHIWNTATEFLPKDKRDWKADNNLHIEDGATCSIITQRKWPIIPPTYGSREQIRPTTARRPTRGVSFRSSTPSMTAARTTLGRQVPRRPALFVWWWNRCRDDARRKVPSKNRRPCWVAKSLVNQ